jgi:hypothetical protein
MITGTEEAKTSHTKKGEKGRGKGKKTVPV